MSEVQLPNKRRYGDIHFRLSVKDGDVPISWDSAEIKRLFMYSEKQRGFGGKCSFQLDDDPHYLDVTFAAYNQQFLGVHRVVVQLEVYGQVATYDARVCNIVASTSNGPVIYDDVIDVSIEVSEVDTTVLHEIIAACKLATEEAIGAAERAEDAVGSLQGGRKNEVLTKRSDAPLDFDWKPFTGRDYVSLERLRRFLYGVTFDTLPEAAGETALPAGGCSAYVRDGKLYRNLDFKYDNAASFIVRTRDFEGMSFITGLNDGEMDDELIAQLPYRMVDGRNNNGIMVSVHVLFNDWHYSGAGDRSIPLTRLPFEVLTRVRSMATIAADLSAVIGNLTATAGMGDYLIQMLITDGETTYALVPPEADGLGYVLIDATANPKMSNFRWVERSEVSRSDADLQDRPTGVERWNLMPCPLEDLRFTKAYEIPSRLSEFIGIGDTTKDSTDAELTVIYNSARAEYLTRERDGQTWQTMHSVVYGEKMEDLYIQEDWTDNCAPVSKEYVDEEVARVEAAIPDVSHFITKSVNDLVNYYLKSETYTRAEVQEIINTVKQFVYEAVTELPVASAQTMHKIYLVPSDKPEIQNVRDEFITIDNGVSAETRYTWEQIGSTAIDLSGYYTSQQTDAAISTALTTALANYTTTAALTLLLAGKQEALTPEQLAAVNSGITATKLTELEQNVGNLPSLTTTEKSNLVGAVNEVNAKKANTDGYYESMTVGNAGNLAGNVVEDAMFTRRTSGGYASIKSGAATIKALKGNTIVWNQLVDASLLPATTIINGVTFTNNMDGSVSVRGTAVGGNASYIYSHEKETPVGGHKVYLSGLGDSAVEEAFSDLAYHTWVVNKNEGKAILTAEDYRHEPVGFGRIRIIVREGVTVEDTVRPQIFDLTQMFGAGNEPITVEEFEALFPNDYYPYNAGELLPFNGTGIKTDGFNQFDGTKAKVFGGQAYYINGTYSTLKFAKTIDGEQTDITPSSNLYTPTEDGYIFATGTSAEFCINLSHSGIRNGEYEPYWTETKQLPSLDFFHVTYTGADGQQHVAVGMKSAGTAKDEWNGTKKVRRIGVVDLGTLNWSLTTNYFIAPHASLGLKYINNTTAINAINTRYAIMTAQSQSVAAEKTLSANEGYLIVRDSAYTDAASFKASLAGVLLFYELAEPVEADAEPLGNYREDDWGTETLLPENDDEPTTSPIIADIMYGIDAVGTIRNLPKDYISKVSMDSVLSAMVSAGIIGGYTLTYNGRSYDCTITPISTE